MARSRKLSDKKIRELQIAQGNRGGHAGRFGGLKEKPKNMKATLKKLLSYISYSKGLLIAVIILTLIVTLCTLSTNVLIERIVASLAK